MNPEVLIFTREELLGVLREIGGQQSQLSVS